MTRRTSLLLVLAAGLAGCGGKTSTDDPARPKAARSAPAARVNELASRSELVAAAKRICARMEQRMPAIDPSGGVPTPRELAAIIAGWAATIEELHELRPPAPEAARFARMLRHFDNAVGAARLLPSAEDETALVAVAGMADAGMKGATIARGYGLDECSLVPPAPPRGEFERYVLEQARKEGGMLAPGTLNPPQGRRLPPKQNKRP
ncbi:MAG TPA: hypothetical protein VG144_06120 [Gaiellaceae bacterium]|nr:hypothetical protein [Gaiellaceae bacterium]